jgi:hypothetical protein
MNDLFDFERGPGTLLKFALYPLVLLVVLQAVATLLGKFSAAGLLAVLFLIAFASPIAYFVRKARGRGGERGGGRRGAERTPLLPPDEEVAE